MDNDDLDDLFGDLLMPDELIPEEEGPVADEIHQLFVEFRVFGCNGQWTAAVRSWLRPWVFDAYMRRRFLVGVPRIEPPLSCVSSFLIHLTRFTEASDLRRYCRTRMVTAELLSRESDGFLRSERKRILTLKYRKPAGCVLRDPKCEISYFALVHPTSLRARKVPTLNFSILQMCSKKPHVKVVIEKAPPPPPRMMIKQGLKKRTKMVRPAVTNNFGGLLYSWNKRTKFFLSMFLQCGYDEVCRIDMPNPLSVRIALFRSGTRLTQFANPEQFVFVGEFLHSAFSSFDHHHRGIIGLDISPSPSSSPCMNGTIVTVSGCLADLLAHCCPAMRTTGSQFILFCDVIVSTPSGGMRARNSSHFRFVPEKKRRVTELSVSVQEFGVQVAAGNWFLSFVFDVSPFGNPRGGPRVEVVPFETFEDESRDNDEDDADDAELFFLNEGFDDGYF